MGDHVFNPSRTERVSSIQALRGVAALLVVVSHILRILRESWNGGPAVLAPDMAYGDAGVFAFFIISGFIMYVTARNDFAARGASLRFMSKRLVRIVPMYWLFTALALACPFMLGWREPSLLGLVLSLIFLPDITHVPGFSPVLVVGWTLSFEMLFYAVFAAALSLPRRLGLAVVVSAFVALSLLGKFGAYAPAALAAPWGLAWPMIMHWSQGPILLFVFGILLGVARERLGRAPLTSAQTLWPALAILVAAPATAALRHAVNYSSAALLGAALAVGLCVMSRAPERTSCKGLERLGDASYALYLSHLFVLGGLSAAWLATFGPRAQAVFGVSGALLSCAVAYALHASVEVPLTRVIRRAIQPPATPVPAIP